MSGEVKVAAKELWADWVRRGPAGVGRCFRPGSTLADWYFAGTSGWNVVFEGCTSETRLRDLARPHFHFRFVFDPRRIAVPEPTA